MAREEWSTLTDSDLPESSELQQHRLEWIPTPRTHQQQSSHLLVHPATAGTQRSHALHSSHHHQEQVIPSSRGWITLRRASWDSHPVSSGSPTSSSSWLDDRVSYPMMERVHPPERGSRRVRHVTERSSFAPLLYL
ncbi:unnamed protein product [Linum trigynum]|uniref:Uncharacterized protein n=1 Tax=Linum trigynum TaxID=586398 RepID=A0AAV2F9U8_9ROSI